MAQHLSLITGGNSGIGRAAAAQIMRAGARVVLACRNRERGERAVSDLRRETGTDAVELVVMDMSSRASIEAGVEAFRAMGHARLDSLIHNAADFDISRKAPEFSDEGIETVWATNHIGPVILTYLLDRELSESEGGRVITVASQGLMLHPRLQVRLDDPEFRHVEYRVDRAYYQSKLAQVMYTLWLARRWAGTPRTASCVRVTNVKLDLDRYPGLTDFQKRLYSVKSRFSISPEQMAEVYSWLALADGIAPASGGYFDEKRRSVRAGAWAQDEGNIDALMRMTARYVPEIGGGA